MEAPQRIKNRTVMFTTIPFLDIYVKERKTLPQKDRCTPMFTAGLFTIVKIQKQPKCPSIDKQMNNFLLCGCAYI